MRRRCKGRLVGKRGAEAGSVDLLLRMRSVTVLTDRRVYEDVEKISGTRVGVSMMSYLIRYLRGMLRVSS